MQSLLRQPTGPGSYFLKGKETLVDFLSRAGGPTKDADLTKVQIIRGGKTVLLNLDHAIKQGDWSENAVLDASAYTRRTGSVPDGRINSQLPSSR
ncbi:MAG: SLBB domain-containing protein [Anaerolineae bacterium]